MSAHPHLELRDALAAAFVRACAGAPEARQALDALARWARGESGGEALSSLLGSDAEPLFVASGTLAPRFDQLDSWARDRARRYEHALAWLGQEGAGEHSLGAARAAWDSGLFFEIHELLEPVWLKAAEPVRGGLQALIMASVALHHLCDGNLPGARDLLQEATGRLSAKPDALPLDLASFARGLAELEQGLASGRIRGPGDVSELPRLEPRAAGVCGPS